MPQTPRKEYAVDWEIGSTKKPASSRLHVERVVHVPDELHEFVFCHAVFAERRREYGLRPAGTEPDRREGEVFRRAEVLPLRISEA